MFYGKDIDTIKYLSKTDSLFQISKVSNTNTIKLVGVNNPNNFLIESKLIVYFNNKISYSGEFKKEVVLNISNFKENEIIHLSLEILKDGQLYVLESKSVFNWQKDYMFVYYGLFPSNESTNQIHFFPQKNRVIN